MDDSAIVFRVNHQILSRERALTGSPENMFKILKQTWSDFNDDKCPRIAAALAYYTAFSLAPMLVLIISVSQLVFEPEDIRGRVETEIASVVGNEGAEQVKTMIESTNERTSGSILATVIGVIVMVVGATGMFAQLQAAMNDVWEVKPDPEVSGLRDFLMKRLLSLGMLLTIAFLLIVSLVASTVLHTFDGVVERFLPGQMAASVLLAINFGISFVVLSVLFALMFKVLPDAEVRWSDVTVGAIVTAGLFLAGKFAIGIYIGSQNMSTTYGAAGSLVVILVWVYYSAMILLMGAEFTQAWAKHRGSGIRPSEGAVRVVQHMELRRQ